MPSTRCHQTLTAGELGPWGPAPRWLLALDEGRRRSTLDALNATIRESDTELDPLEAPLARVITRDLLFPDDDSTSPD